MRGVAVIAGLVACTVAACITATSRVNVGPVRATAIAPERTPVQSCIAECRASNESAVTAASVCHGECERMYDDGASCRRDCTACCGGASSAAPGFALNACCPLAADQSCESFCADRDATRTECFSSCDVLRGRANETEANCIAGCGTRH